MKKLMELVNKNSPIKTKKFKKSKMVDENIIKYNFSDLIIECDKSEKYIPSFHQNLHSVEPSYKKFYSRARIKIIKLFLGFALQNVIFLISQAVGFRPPKFIFLMLCKRFYTKMYIL